MFKIGDKVRMKKPNLYNETDGEVSEVVRMYQVVSSVTGKRDTRGLITFEDDIKSTQLPYTFDGTTLKVEFPETDYGSWIQKAYTQTSVFAGYAVTVKTPKMLTRCKETSLFKI